MSKKAKTKAPPLQESPVLRGGNREIAFTLAALAAVSLLHILFIALSGKGLLDSNAYNSYVLQAQAWLKGRLDLGQDYPWLELAIYQDKYFVSFPPLPSLVLLPLAAVFGSNTPDGVAAFLFLLLGVCYAQRLARIQGLSGPQSVALAVFLYGANNLWQVTVDGWVWFIAQNMAFTFTLASFYHAGRGSKGLAALFLMAAVGCRPFQVVYTPLALWLLWESQGERPGRWKWLFWEKDYKLVPAVLLGVFYLTLNTVRFGNPFEFGHNYLPEFTNSEHGQFSASYLSNNLQSLVRLPTRSAENGQWEFPMFNGSCVFLVDPIFLLLAAACGALLVQRIQTKSLTRGQILWGAGAAGLILAHILFICLHKTMGGAHFGNRYIVDTLPAVYLCLCRTVGGSAWAQGKPARRWGVWIGFGLLFAAGLWINLAGTLKFYGVG